MRRASLLLLLLVLSCSLRASTSWAPAPGTLVVVGGGGTPDEVVAHALELAGGSKAKVAVLPFASSREDRGVPTVEMWQEAGAAEVWNLDDPAAGDAAERLSEANLIWMPGGDQTRLIRELKERGLLELVRERHAAGVVAGGTSAGAAVMSLRMLTGPPREDGLLIERANVSEGLGLWPGVIVDQHFVQRDRYGRLLSAVLDKPELVGVGISERTAAIVTFERKGRDRYVPTIEVLGQSSVLVVDARSAEVAEGEPGALHGALGLSLDVLKPGMKVRLEAKGGRAK
ncbi:MAG: cyanophycinase [Planctomycetota bacterium]